MLRAPAEQHNRHLPAERVEAVRVPRKARNTIAIGAYSPRVRPGLLGRTGYPNRDRIRCLPLRGAQLRRLYRSSHDSSLEGSGFEPKRCSGVAVSGLPGPPIVFGTERLALTKPSLVSVCPSTPPTSQLDWLISTTAMIVLLWRRGTCSSRRAGPGGRRLHLPQ